MLGILGKPDQPFGRSDLAMDFAQMSVGVPPPGEYDVKFNSPVGPARSRDTDSQ
jgi:hypothetical protein